MFWRLSRKTSAAALAAALTAAVLAAVFSSQPAQTQAPTSSTTTSGNIPLLAATGCTDGTFVDTTTHPTVTGANNDLVDDCQTLVQIQNYWAANTANNDLHTTHPLRTWGTATTQKINTWAGITVTSSRITTITLLIDSRYAAGITGPGMEGGIPTQIDSLTNLTNLNLGFNLLSGRIPAELGNLTNLESLELQGNLLTGSIPIHLTNLTNLNLGLNLLSGRIPAELGNLTNLESLELQGNRLTGSIPIHLANLTNLESLELRANRLTGSIPIHLANLTNLESLELGSNQLSGHIPAELGNLARSRGGSLITFGICQNSLTGSVPVPLRTILSSVSGTSRVFPVPYPVSEGFNPIACQRTAQSNTAISALSSSGCTDGTFVDTAANPIVSGANNDLVDDCQALVAIQNQWASVIANNNLEANHPLRTWGKATTQKIDTWSGVGVSSNRVTTLRLANFPVSTPITYQGPGIDGAIPTQIGNLAALTTLELRGNRLSGSIPSQLGNLADLTLLGLSYNRLSGNIPAALGNLSNLITLRLNSNLLSGSIPSELDSLAPSQSGALNSFGFCWNYLTGAMPTSLRAVTVVDNNLDPSGQPVTVGFDPLTCQVRGNPLIIISAAPSIPFAPPATDPPASSTTTTMTTPSSTAEDSRDSEEPNGPVWNTFTVQPGGTTASQIRRTLGLTSRDAIYAWDATAQRWQRTTPTRTIPAGTALSFRTEQRLSQDNLEELNLGGTRRTTLTTGWNLLSTPTQIQQPETTTDTDTSSGTDTTGGTRDTSGEFLFANELLDCDSPTAILAVASYSPTTQQWSLWLPCHPAVQTRLTTGDNPPYQSLTSISPQDTTYIYTRTRQPVAITWNPDTSQYQPS